MTNRTQILFWLLGLGVAIALVWLLGGVLVPFLTGIAIAFVLNPLADRLEPYGLPRWSVAILVLSSFYAVVTTILVFLVPIVARQLIDLLGAMPLYWEELIDLWEPTIERALAYLSIEQIDRLNTMAEEALGGGASWAMEGLVGLMRGGLAVVNLVSFLIVTPVVAFYLLRDWNGFVERIDSWLPRQHADTIRMLARRVNSSLAGFLRGQALVCLALGAFYAIGLTLVGLNYAIAVGLTAGILSFIPFVGTIVGFVSSVGIAFFQFDSMVMVAVVIVIFLVGQLIEGYFLTPRLVGDRVGLHPVWIIFALFAGGSLLGFVGVLLAVPMAAVIGVLLRFALALYLDSRFYSEAVDGDAEGSPNDVQRAARDVLSEDDR